MLAPGTRPLRSQLCDPPAGAASAPLLQKRLRQARDEITSRPSDGCSTRDEVSDKGDDRDHQQKMDKSGRDMKRQEAHSPQNHKHKSDYP